MFQRQYAPLVSKKTPLSTAPASARVHFPALFFLAVVLAAAVLITASPYIGPVARDVANFYGP